MIATSTITSIDAFSNTKIIRPKKNTVRVEESILFPHDIDEVDKETEGDGREKRGQREQEGNKVAVVQPPDARAQKNAVVVENFNTGIANAKG